VEVGGYPYAQGGPTLVLNDPDDEVGITLEVEHDAISARIVSTPERTLIALALQGAEEIPERAVASPESGVLLDVESEALDSLPPLD
jgi:hypothetical protein